MTRADGIFADASGRRWSRFWRYGAVTLLVVLVLVLAFVQTLLVPPSLLGPNQPADPRTELRSLIVAEGPHNTFRPPEWLLKESAAQPGGAKLASQGTAGTVRAGYYVDWDPNSLLTLKENARDLTHVIPEWFVVAEMPPRLIARTDDAGLKAVAEQHDLTLLPLLTNLLGSAWQPEPVEALLRGPAQARQAFAEQLAGELMAAGAGGVLIDWQQLDPVHRDAYTRFIGELAKRLHRDGLELWLAVPVGLDIKVLDLRALSGKVDRFLAMLHDENGESDPAGPVASQPWFEEWLAVLLNYGTPAQWVIAIGSYGYDWPEDGPAETLGFMDAMTRARSQSPDTVRAEAPLYSPHFSYGAEGAAREVWFLDAVTFRNQAELVRRRGGGGIALYRLGSEDPGVWEVMSSAATAPPGPASLETLASSNRVAHVGRGDFLKVIRQASVGHRSVRVDDRGLWTTRYERFPSFTTLLHSGGGVPNQVAVTFDDGPDPEWTPQILDVLKAKNAKAAFFVVGVQAERHPDLVQRMLDEGHEVGVHTYFHPDLSLVSSGRLALELNATQHLLEGLLQRSTVLFRPPYNVDSRPGITDEVLPLLQAQELGYVTVAQSIDTLDWDQPGVDVILERVKATRAEGNTLLMHDAGGDRSQTVEALPLIIDWLRARGDEVVSLATLLGASPGELMPPLATGEDELIARTGFDVLRFLERFFWAFMILATLLVLLRTLAVFWLAVRQQRRLAEESRPESVETPPVSVLIAAYNEDKVIGATLRSVLASRYRGEIEVVVVDDGSRDGTAAEVERVAEADPRVRLVRQPNQGKAHALQNALAHASHRTLVMLDADTQFEPATLGELVCLLERPNVGAVSGHVKVGNQRGWLGRFQALEYTCGFNLDRRAYDLLDCVTVVPGAACAMRRDALEQAGGFSADTLAEDTDLTLALHRAGWSVRYNPEAIAWTEAPETIGALSRQRVRWSFGTLQCLWKHRDMLLNPQFGWLGFFSLPSIALFQMFLVAMIPLVDALLIASLVWGFGLAIAHYAVIFLLVDLVLALLASRMEGEPLWRAAYILPMRLLYRPLLAYAVWHSLFRALRGRWSGWSKLERRGNVLMGHPGA